MDSPETLSTLVTQNTRRRQTKQKQNTTILFPYFKQVAKKTIILSARKLIQPT
jgi:hypothetical protein